MKSTRSLPWAPLVTLWIVSSSAPAWSQRVVISEIDVRPNPDGLEWIEVYNPSDTAETLDGYSLERERLNGEAAIYELPRGVVIGPQQFIVLCTSCTDQPCNTPYCLCISREPPDGGCASDLLPFRLDANGGVISLFWQPRCQRRERRKVDSTRYPPMPVSHTWGRVGEYPEAEFCVTKTPTPGRANDLCADAIPGLYINEVSSAEAEQQGDCTFPSCPDWVEIYWDAEYYPGLDSMELTGFVLQNGSEVDDRFVFPPVQLTREQPFVVVHARSGVPDDDWGPDALHARFGIKSQGDWLVLVSPQGVDADRVSIPRLGGRACREVYTRYPDGGDFTFSEEVTPGAPNVVPPALGPCCEVVDRLPARVLPTTPIEVLAEITDRDGDTNEIELWWESPGQLPDFVPMTLGKRPNCTAREDEAIGDGLAAGQIYTGTIPPVFQMGLVQFWVRARDGANNQRESLRWQLQVQEESWQDPDRANPTHALRINEVFARGGGNDWVELFNPLPSGEIFLDRILISDSSLRLNNRQLPPFASIKAGEFMRIHLDGLDIPDLEEPHLPFRLSACRDEVILMHRSAQDGREVISVIDVVQVKEEKANLSTGRIPDGADVHPEGEGILVLMRPTPIGSNLQTTCAGFLDDGNISGAVVINEVLADNWVSGHDLGGEFGDWIELYNRSDGRVQLDGWGLTDCAHILNQPPEEQRDSLQRCLWRFPPRTCIAAGGRLVIWCDNDPCENLPQDGDRCGAPALELHTDFEINRGADGVLLVGPDLQIVDAVRVQFQARDIAAGRLTDGSSEIGFLIPTPGGPNKPAPLTQTAVDRCRCFPRENCEPVFLRGDANDDCRIDLADPIYLLAALFQGAGTPACLDAADVDDGGVLQMADAIYLLNHLFAGGPAPAEPYPGRGSDPTEDGLARCLAAECEF